MNVSENSLIKVLKLSIYVKLASLRFRKQFKFRNIKCVDGKPKTLVNRNNGTIMH